jgi:hypothetical protein
MVFEIWKMHIFTICTRNELPSSTSKCGCICVNIFICPIALLALYLHGTYEINDETFILTLT